MGTGLTRFKPAIQRAPPTPVPRKRKRATRTKRKVPWKWLAILAAVVFGLALTAQIILVYEDLKRLASHHEGSDALIYGIASVALMLGWLIEEIYEEDWTGAFRSAASVFFFYCYNEGFESAFRSATGHELPMWQVTFLSPLVGKTAAESLSVIGTIALAVALLWAFDNMGKASVSMGFHAYDEYDRERTRKARGQ